MTVSGNVILTFKNRSIPMAKLLQNRAPSEGGNMTVSTEGQSLQAKSKHSIEVKVTEGILDGLWQSIQSTHEEFLSPL